MIFWEFYKESSCHAEDFSEERHFWQIDIEAGQGHYSHDFEGQLTSDHNNNLVSTLVYMIHLSLLRMPLYL